MALRYATFRREIAEFAAANATDELRAEARRGGGEGRAGPRTAALHEELEKRGWPRIAWPESYGGGGRSPWYQFVMVQEFSYFGIPYGGLSVGSVAPALMNFGTEEQESPHRHPRGEMTFAIGYAEPNAGTDLAPCKRRGPGRRRIRRQRQKIWT